MPKCYVYRVFLVNEMSFDVKNCTEHALLLLPHHCIQCSVNISKRGKNLPISLKA